MNSRQSNLYAPYGTCCKCGWTGKDWGFKYHNFCTKCYKQWRKTKAEENRKHKEEIRQLKPPNKNIEITNGIIITRNVLKRLKRQAYFDVPRTNRINWFSFFDDMACLIIFLAVIILWLTIWTSPQHAAFPAICALIGFIIHRVFSDKHTEEKTKRDGLAKSRLEELARDRQKKIDEMKAFYASSEWRLVREKVIQEQGRACQNCGCKILNDYYLTVDHIKPRSKFPELALDKSNLQVLCRKCNSSKGAIYNEETASVQSATLQS